MFYGGLTATLTSKLGAVDGTRTHLVLIDNQLPSPRTTTAVRKELKAFNSYLTVHVLIIAHELVSVNSLSV